MEGLALLAIVVATFALAFYLIVRNRATEQETSEMLDDDIWS